MLSPHLEGGQQVGGERRKGLRVRSPFISITHRTIGRQASPGDLNALRNQNENKMRHTWLYLWLLHLYIIAQVLATTTIEWSSNIDDQEPAASVLVARNISKNKHYLEPLDRVFDLYNVGRLARVWPEHVTTITETCNTKMRVYLEAYRKREDWALRSE